MPCYAEYKPGTRIEICGRVFVRTSTGSFWREEHEVPGNRVSRPSASLEALESVTGSRHAVLTNR